MSTSQVRNDKPTIAISGSSGLIGTRLTEVLKEEYVVVGLDVKPFALSVEGVPWIECDLTSDESMQAAFERLAADFGRNLASFIHLAAYYDFSGEPSPLYEELTVEGTRRVLQALQSFEVEQFVFSSSLLVMKSSESGEPITEESPVEAEWDYPESKLKAERIIAQQRGEIPTVILRLAGVYDENCHSIPIAQQIRRIYEKELESYLFPGNTDHGQSFIHLDDVVACVRRVVEKRASLPQEDLLLIGEEDVMSYDELQDTIGELLHGRQWPAIRIPKVAAKAGAWVKEKLATDESEEPFIKSWMIDLADQNYPISMRRAREQLHWEPDYSLRGSLPAMIDALKNDPAKWYEENGLPMP